MRRFKLATKEIEINDKKEVVAQYPQAKLPEYATKHSAGADFFCAEKVVVPPTNVKEVEMSLKFNAKPTLVHTGIKASMEENEVLLLFNRSGNPAKLGLVLANGVGVIDADYYGNVSNDGEIMFAFYNFSDKPVTLEVGDKLGQGVFTTFLHPDNAVIKDTERAGGFGHTGSR